MSFHPKMAYDATFHKSTRTLADAVSLEKAIPAILQAFCTHVEADICSLWLLDETGDALSCAHLEHSGAADEFAQFINETRRLSLGKDTGLPGQVWRKNAPLWLPNTVRGSKYPRASLAALAGLHSAIGYVTPEQKLAGMERDIFDDRDRKLAEARQRRAALRQAEREVAA